MFVLETQSEAERRGVTPYARFLGWGQGSDGHNVAIYLIHKDRDRFDDQSVEGCQIGPE